MRIYIYGGGEKIVGRSGVGQAIRHQRECLRRSGVDTTDHWTADAAAVHVNTILPDSVLAALGAKLRRRKVVWYGHSTMEDFRSSFKGSNALAPLFKRWITFCYGLGDVVLTPTEYSRELLESYGLKKPVYSISNGVDTDFFHPDPAARPALRARYGLAEDKQVVVKIKAGEGGKAFGSVSSKEIATAFKEQHDLELDKKKIQLPESLKNFGTFEVPIKLHPQVTGKLIVKVTEKE